MESKIKVDLFTLCWNEMGILPFAVDYWKKFADHVTVYDNGSTDGSVDFLEKFDFVTIKTFGLNDLKHNHEMKKIKNTCWKGSSADLVVVCDLDEFVFAKDIMSSFRNMLDQGATLCAPQWYDLFSEEKPEHEDGKMLHDIRPMGIFNPNGKTLIFNPKKIKDIGYTIGAHKCYPSGNVKYYGGKDIFCLHVSHNLSFEDKCKDYEILAKRRSEDDKRHGFSTHYFKDRSRLEREWESMRKCAINLKAIVDSR